MLFRALRSTKNNASDVRKLPKASNQPGNRWLSTVFQQPARKRRAPAHRQRRVRSAQLAELVQLDGSLHDWLEGRGPLLTALGMQDDATGKILAAQFFPSETTFGYLCLLHQLVCRYGVPLPFSAPPRSLFLPHPPTTTPAALPGRLAKTPPHGARLRKISSASAASCTNPSSATTTSCNGRDAASRSLNRHAVSASPEPKCRSTKPSMGASRSITARPACSTPHYQGGDSFMLPLG